MWQRCDGRYIWAAMAIALVAVSLLPGCVRVEVLDRSMKRSEVISPLIPRLSLADEHDLAVLALDLEPRLEYEKIVSNDEGVTLLVAVENVGVWTETDVKVEARLSSNDGSEVILEKTTRIDAIAPGETKVVRLRSPSRIPYLSAYLFEVHVSPVAKEAHTTNNHKSYEIRITKAE